MQPKVVCLYLLAILTLSSTGYALPRNLPRSPPGFAVLQSASNPPLDANLQLSPEALTNPVKLIMRPKNKFLSSKALQTALGLDMPTWTKFIFLVEKSADAVFEKYEKTYMEVKDKVNALCFQIGKNMPAFDDTHYQDFWPTQEALKLHIWKRRNTAVSKAIRHAKAVQVGRTPGDNRRTQLGLLNPA
ncbi:hypothetical protein BDP27DRAFT_1373698 [Rhodocollybia butyracea]|uniref:Uncharacterized protein n=1 Tax=Rhodocollybia butyracea TaxID=206335 RepID=A0A9P5P2V9_9AGAR|nr:hypothetical protein BDP27DRAFT_1373698 [Rhodocollybia butyracea]